MSLFPEAKLVITEGKSGFFHDPVCRNAEEQWFKFLSYCYTERKPDPYIPIVITNDLEEKEECMGIQKTPMGERRFGTRTVLVLDGTLAGSIGPVAGGIGGKYIIDPQRMLIQHPLIPHVELCSELNEHPDRNEIIHLAKTHPTHWYYEAIQKLLLRIDAPYDVDKMMQNFQKQQEQVIFSYGF